MTPETIIKNQAKDWLDIKGYFHFHIAMSMGAYKGIPDRYAIKNGNAFWIEFKTPKGKLSIHQEMFKANLERQGGKYVICRVVPDDLINAGL